MSSFSVSDDLCDGDVKACAARSFRAGRGTLSRDKKLESHSAFSTPPAWVAYPPAARPDQTCGSRKTTGSCGSPPQLPRAGRVPGNHSAYGTEKEPSNQHARHNKATQVDKSPQAFFQDTTRTPVNVRRVPRRHCISNSIPSPPIYKPDYGKRQILSHPLQHNFEVR